MDLSKFLNLPLAENTVGYILLTVLAAGISAALTAYVKNRGASDVARINAESADRIDRRKTELELTKILRAELDELREARRDGEERERMLEKDIGNLIDHLIEMLSADTEDQKKRAQERAKAYLAHTGRRPSHL